MSSLLKFLLCMVYGYVGKEIILINKKGGRDTHIISGLA